MIPLGIMIAGANGYTITNAIVLDGVASYLHWTPGVAGNQKIMTYSLWFERAGLGSGNSGTLFGGATISDGFRFGDGTNNDWIDFYFNGTVAGQLITSQVLRDPTGWSNLVVAIDTTQAVASDRVKIYRDGVQITALSTAAYPALNYVSGLGGTGLQTIGQEQNLGGQFYDGAVAEFIRIDGAALAPTSFGEFDTNGTWQPIDPSGLTFGANGFWLDFENALNPGTDVSGNANNFTAVSIPTTAQVADSPTDSAALGVGNYCVLDPIRPMSGGTNASAYISNGGLVHQAGGVNPQDVAGTLAIPSSGIFQIECRITLVSGSPQSTYLGFVDLDRGLTTGFGIFSRADTAAATGSVKVLDGVESGAGLYPTWKTANVDCGMVYDVGADTVSCYINGVLQWTQAAASTYLTGSTIIPYIQNGDGTQVTVDFGQKGFNHPIAGTTGLSTANLPDPAIPDPSKHFQSVAYTGTGASNAITLTDASGAAVAPDLVWIKERNGLASHQLFDSVRGAGKYIWPDDTAAEGTDIQRLTTFDASGFTVGTATQTNTLSNTYIGWCWKAGGAPVLNTAGTINSQVSANQAAGFSIMTGTHAATGDSTFGHGLLQKPEFIIVKDLDGITNWTTTHKDASTNMQDVNTLALNSTGAVVFAAGIWGSEPTASLIGIGWNDQVAFSHRFVCYAFHSVEGFSKFGSYTGNLSTDGPFVYCGFRPAFVLIKRIAAAESWYLLDSTRSPYNQTANILYGDTSAAEVTTTANQMDMLATGFKLRGANNGTNATGEKLIYAAFAEMPVQGQSRGR